MDMLVVIVCVLSSQAVQFFTRPLTVCLPDAAFVLVLRTHVSHRLGSRGRRDHRLENFVHPPPRQRMAATADSFYIQQYTMEELIGFVFVSGLVLNSFVLIKVCV